MSAALHTRGPWQAMPEEADKPYIRIRGTRLGGRFKIANVHAEKHPVLLESLRDRKEAESRANAMLIAAAPELLVALQNLCGEWTGGDGMSLGERIHMARAAIAKATKEHP